MSDLGLKNQILQLIEDEYLRNFKYQFLGIAKTHKPS
mgnify:FL=1